MEAFNVMQHELVPEHRLLSEGEAEELLKRYEVDRDRIPKIRKKDPAILLLERVTGDIHIGSIIKIIRKSTTAGETIFYRVVVAESVQEINLGEIVFSFDED